MKSIIIIVFAMAGAMFATPSYSHSAEISYNEIFHQGVYHCKNRSRASMKQTHIDMIRLMIKVEQGFNVPKQLRGMLVAAACSESGYNPSARGDFRMRKRRGKMRRIPMAIGILQQWPWYESFYKINRRDPTEAAFSWMSHIKRQIPKVKKRCKPRNKKKLWIAAWVHGIRAPKQGGRCKEAPLHLKILKRWHKNIRRDHRLGVEYLDYEDGWIPENEFYDEPVGC